MQPAPGSALVHGSAGLHCGAVVVCIRAVDFVLFIAFLSCLASAFQLE